MTDNTNDNLEAFRISEVFEVDFYIEAENYDKAKDIYNKMFDKNIQLGYDTWKNVSNKNIKGGKFHVKTYDKGEEATLLEELWGDYLATGEEE